MEKREKLKKYGFDLETYQKAKDYESDNLKVTVLSSVLSVIILFLFLWFGTKPLHNSLLDLVDNVWFGRIAYILIFAVGFFLLDLPSGWISFRIEHKYGLSNQSPADWLIDEFKGLIII